MFNIQTQKLRKRQQPKTERQTARERKVSMRRLKKNRRQLWIIKEEL
jgi:hypothetical protein